MGRCGDRSGQSCVAWPRVRLFICSHFSAPFTRQTIPDHSVIFVRHAQMSSLSPWGQAVVAAAAGDSATLTKLLKEDASMRSQRVSQADSAFFASDFSMNIASGRLLVELALERDHEEVVLLLLQEPEQSEPEAQRRPSFDTRNEPLLRRAISEVSPGVLAERLRDHVVESIQSGGAHPGGEALWRLVLPPGERQTFFLPRELSALEPEAQAKALGLLTEAADVLPQIERSVGWWNNALRDAIRAAAGGVPQPQLESGLRAIYTSADGNCLLHACLLAALGVRDRRVARAGTDPGASAPEEPRPRRLIRALTHAALRWPPLRALLQSHGANVDALEERSAAHGHSLEVSAP